MTLENQRKIVKGIKTVTRRIWKVPHVLVGSTYRLRMTRFQKNTDEMPQIRILNIRKEYLGDMTEVEAEKEGCANLSEFQQQWKELHGVWDPGQEIYRIEFEKVKRGESGGR